MSASTEVISTLSDGSGRVVHPCSECRARDFDNLDLIQQMHWLYTGMCRDCLLEKVGEVRGRIEFYAPGVGVYLVTQCQRCSGKGIYIVSSTQPGSACFRCGGTGYIFTEKAITQRVARWWQTYQQNRQPSERDDTVPIILPDAVTDNAEEHS